MAIDTNSPGPRVISSKQTSPHFFAPLSASEISQSAELINAAWPQGTDLQFKVITLEEPPKKDVVPLLEAENNGETFAPLDRKAMIIYYIRNTVCYRVLFIMV